MKKIATMAASATLAISASAGDGLSYNAELAVGFDRAIEQVTAALKTEGFGIVSRIDMHTTFKKKLGLDTSPHTILGACNPKFAYKAVSTQPEVALMLPCNVTLQQLEAQRVIVRLVNPMTMMTVGAFQDSAALREVGEHADAAFRRVAEALRK